MEIAGYPEGDWILPHEDGVVPDSLLRRLTELASVRPRILLIIDIRNAMQRCEEIDSYSLAAGA
jgi:hypothetical protein